MSELLLEHHIISNHDDDSAWAALSVGFNDDKYLVFDMVYDEFDDYEPGQKWYKQIVVDDKGIDILRTKLRKPLMQLPEYFGEHFGYDGDAHRADDVIETFYSIEHYLSAMHIQYTTKHRDVQR